MNEHIPDGDEKESPEVAPESGDKLVNIGVDNEETETFPPEEKRGSEAAGEDFE